MGMANKDFGEEGGNGMLDERGRNNAPRWHALMK